MRHFRDELRREGRVVHYHALGHRPADDRGETFAEILEDDLRRLEPDELVVCQPGDHRVLGMIRGAAETHGLDLQVTEDRHFIVSREQFEGYVEEHKGLLLETFYRALRRRESLLITDDGEPVGGRWNYDEDNRKSFGKMGPDWIKRPRRFTPDDVTKDVIDMVQRRFGDHPGSLDHFDLPVTHRQALASLRDFVEHRLHDFGTYEDAMWSSDPFLYHSRLSIVLNVKLLSPRKCIDAAVEAYEAGKVPLNSVEGFVRQIMGWRELVRGIYWHYMPDYATGNALECEDRGVPRFFWDGQTQMRCVASCMQSVIDHAWSHHITRLMVLGQLALLLGVHPYRFHEWHMAMYVDAIDWVSLPNTLGMSQWGDGGIVGTKPYCASGNYINRMSDYCKGCPYEPKAAVGDEACPFTTLYWDFLARHRRRFERNPRMALQLRNLKRKDAGEVEAIRRRAGELRGAIDRGERI
jgi:deoxyribodipyrimidine photolyase-related protein